MEKSLESVGLPLPDVLDSEAARHKALYDPATCQQQYDDNFKQLNSEQMIFLQTVQKRLAQREGGLLFLNRAAGKPGRRPRCNSKYETQFILQVAGKHSYLIQLFRTFELKDK